MEKPFPRLSADCLIFLYQPKFLTFLYQPLLSDLPVSSLTFRPSHISPYFPTFPYHPWLSDLPVSALTFWGVQTRINHLNIPRGVPCPQISVMWVCFRGWRMPRSRGWYDQWWSLPCVISRLCLVRTLFVQQAPSINHYGEDQIVIRLADLPFVGSQPLSLQSLNSLPMTPSHPSQITNLYQEFLVDS